MTKLFLTIIVSLNAIVCIAQKVANEVSLACEIRKEFDYDSLSSLSCLNTPVGFYAIKFSVDRNGKFYNFSTTTDSVKQLTNFFINAIKKSNFSNNQLRFKNGQYIQIIYFANTVHCNPYRKKDNSFIISKADTADINLKDYDKEIVKMLSDQLVSIKNSLVDMQQTGFSNQPLFFLPVALITDENPNTPKNTPSFNDDIKRFLLKNSEIEVIEKRIKEIKH